MSDTASRAYARPDVLFGRELSMGKTLGLMGTVSMVTAAARKLTRAGVSEVLA